MNIAFMNAYEFSLACILFSPKSNTLGRAYLILLLINTQILQMNHAFSFR